MWLRRCAVLVTTDLAHRHVEIHEWGVHEEVRICSLVALEVGAHACILPVFPQQQLYLWIEVLDSLHWVRLTI